VTTASNAMIKIVKAEQMRELDRLTVERAGIP
jgi:hypothetical protein